jgi:hypothetical protein
MQAACCRPGGATGAAPLHQVEVQLKDGKAAALRLIGALAGP